MARLDGGIFSRPRGKTANIVFGAARTREGKVVTARELVPPSNPNTPDQQSQRSIFSDSLYIVRQLGQGIYQSDWNRAIAQLPGFQGMMSIFMNNMDDTLTLGVPAEVNLGNLHVPDSFSASPGASGGDFDLTWSTEVEGTGGPSDTAVVLAIGAGAAGLGNDRIVQIETGEIRSAGSLTISTGNPSAEPVIALYFRGDTGTDRAGLVSNAKWDLGV